MASTLPRFAADDAAVRSFNLDQLVRERTAGKGYKPAPQWTLCEGCAQPCSSRERVAINADGSVRHERCR